ncbi:MAG: Fur family transcriptional regulator [Ignavibacteriaceae bacterium]
MKPDTANIRETISSAGLKVTPQRVAVLEAIYKLGNHPTADNIKEYIRKEHPNIATGTIYNVLESLTEKKIIKKVLTDKDVMRYDGIATQHHHLYCMKTARIIDYSDPELDKLLGDYFKRKIIPNFNVDEIKIQINGKFNKQTKG